MAREKDSGPKYGASPVSIVDYVYIVHWQFYTVC